MERIRTEKEAIIGLLQQWGDKSVRIHVFSHGVGLFYDGYLDFAYDERQIGPEPYPVEPPLPDFALLYKEPTKGVRLFTETPLVAIQFNQFASFERIKIEIETKEIVSLKNRESKVLIERGKDEPA
jgi:hypothetical protein